MVTPPTDNQSAPPVPTCYRHPGRETYVSCVRCGRHACPDCLRPAAVGHQCVECINAGNKTVRQATGRFGGRVSGTARVTWTLMGINLVLYLVLIAHPSLQYDWGMIAGARYNGGLIGVVYGQWYRMLTSAFIAPGLGLGLLDIAFNMYALYIVGPAIERMLGATRFLGVYLASALGGSLGFYLLGPVNTNAMGASGAIFGLFGAWFVLARRLRLDWRPVVTLIVLNLAIGFVGHSIIAWQAHVGGLITGLVLTAAYVYAPSRNRGLIQLAATAGVLALIVAGVVLRDYQLVGRVIL
jgi:membrane associated rhomboid family serine protease